jgi:hypothetical protein
VGPADIRDDPVPALHHFVMKIVYQRGESIVDRHAVLTCLGENRVAEDPLIVGIQLDRVQSVMVRAGSASGQECQAWRGWGRNTSLPR